METVDARLSDKLVKKNIFIEGRQTQPCSIELQPLVVHSISSASCFGIVRPRNRE